MRVYICVREKQLTLKSAEKISIPGRDVSGVLSGRGCSEVFPRQLNDTL